MKQLRAVEDKQPDGERKWDSKTRHKELTRQIAKEWNEMSEEQKSHYLDKAKELKAAKQRDKLDTH